MTPIIPLLYSSLIVLAHTASVQQTSRHMTTDTSTQAEPYRKLDDSRQIDHVELRDDNFPDNTAESVPKPSEKVSLLENTSREEKTASMKQPSGDSQQKLDDQVQHNVDIKDAKQQDDAKQNSDKEAFNILKDGQKSQQIGITTEDAGGNHIVHNDKKDMKEDAGEVQAPKPIQKPNNVILAPDIGGSKADNQVVKQDADHKEVDKSGIQASVNGVDDDDSSSPTVLWFVLFSVVIVISVAIYLHRSGLRAPSSLGFEPVSRHSHAEEVPLMTPVDQIVSSALLNLRVPASAVEKYVQAFHNYRIAHIEQLDDPTWQKLALPSAIELELRTRFQEVSIKPRSAGLTLHRDNGSRSTPNIDDVEFDDWSFDDEEINNEI